MKKVALSLLALALVGTAAFADDSMAGTTFTNPLTATLDVNAQAQFGYDLDNSVHGFANAVTAKITLWFLNGSSDKTGAGDVHGYIQAADVKYGTDDANTSPALSFGDVTAKIVAGDLYVKLYTNTDPSVGYGVDSTDGSTKAYSADDTFYMYAGKYGATAEWSLAGLASYSSIAGTGVTIGYSLPKIADLTFGVASASDWKGVQGGYEASGEVSLTAVDKLSLAAKFYTGKSTDALTAFGASVGYDLGIVAPFADINYNVTDSTYVSDFGSKGALIDGLTVAVFGQYASTKVINAQATVSLAADKLAGPLAANLGVKLLDVTKAVAAQAVTEIFAGASLKATDTVKVYGSLDTYNTASSTDTSIFVKAGLDYTGISLTTISVNWDSNDFGAAKTTKKANGTDAATLGSLVLTAKVAY